MRKNKCYWEIYSKRGKYGGTYAHKDIAFGFASAISPVFKLYLIKEFERLKELENQNRKWLKYAKEVDILNVVLFHTTAKKWRELNPDYENSIKESISAVESLCCIITGLSGGNATLGKAIK